MILQKRKKIYTELANKYKLPSQVVEVICNHPFKFANSIISDPDDITSIMFAYLFKIKLKSRLNNDKHTKFVWGNKLVPESQSED